MFQRYILAFAIFLIATDAQFSGIATYFSNANIGACGQSINGQTQVVCGISSAWFANAASPNNDPKCYSQTGNCVQVSYGAKTITVPVMDTCNCASKSDINLSQAAFEQLAPVQLGVIPIQWSFVNVAAAPMPSSPSCTSCTNVYEQQQPVVQQQPEVQAQTVVQQQPVVQTQTVIQQQPVSQTRNVYQSPPIMQAPPVMQAPQPSTCSVCG